ncbi:hypothetical protein J8273_5060 [Carpediemonas membranifera]|uniref:Uncharacterized protein n=1 Tax=Carpediemonas membranifera TaxID=201153 RepID=A0A8J6APW8_9EUKA|nr:hypothetical protein J8273_8187 [Carpediemonas membranifera]KAG9392777.1 hypothetical protein J8273_5921 [Carpediemonas membranifera]KAG9393573.1 hypothetical protein J8273_5060 [Carpediemonas membranifera]|eukprot:KAG9390148.1 hypothetical protein J8273_8187 [Carpediemonas membranifera]
MDEKYGEFGTRRISKDQEVFECVCGKVQLRRGHRGIGFKSSSSHECPFTTEKLINRRVLITIEPLHGFETPTQPYPVFRVESLANSSGYHFKLKTALELVDDEWLTAVARTFKSTSHLAEVLEELASQYSNFDTYWVISGHSDTETSRMIIDTSTNEFLYHHDLVQLILRSFESPSLVRSTRVRLIYFATCSGLDRSEESQLCSAISTAKYKNTCIILTPEKVLAHELVLQDAYWLYRVTCLDNPLFFLTKYFSGYRFAPGSAGRRIIANGSLSFPNEARVIMSETSYARPIPLPEMQDIVSDVNEYDPLRTDQRRLMNDRYISMMTRALERDV